MKKLPKYPAELYIKRESEGGETYFVAHDTLETVAELGEVVDVAIYQLVRTNTVHTDLYLGRT